MMRRSKGQLSIQIQLWRAFAVGRGLLPLVSLCLLTALASPASAKPQKFILNQIHDVYTRQTPRGTEQVILANIRSLELNGKNGDVLLLLTEQNRYQVLMDLAVEPAQLQIDSRRDRRPWEGFSPYTGDYSMWPKLDGYPLRIRIHGERGESLEIIDLHTGGATMKYERLVSERGWDSVRQVVGRMGEYIPTEEWDPRRHFPTNPLVKDLIFKALAADGNTKPQLLLPVILPSPKEVGNTSSAASPYFGLNHLVIAVPAEQYSAYSSEPIISARLIAVGDSDIRVFGAPKVIAGEEPAFQFQTENFLLRIPIPSIWKRLALRQWMKSSDGQEHALSGGPDLAGEAKPFRIAAIYTSRGDSRNRSAKVEEHILEAVDPTEVKAAFSGEIPRSGKVYDPEVVKHLRTNAKAFACYNVW